MSDDEKKLTSALVDMIGAWHHLYEVQTKRLDGLRDGDRKRRAGINSSNGARRRRAENNYRSYRDAAERLIAKNPTLRRKTHRLAQLVQQGLKKRGGEVVSVRTISKALRPQNKV